MTCDVCGAEMLDQRAKKQNPKQPDFTCTNPECVNEKGYRTGKWLRPKKGPSGPFPARSEAPPPAAGPKWTWPQLRLTYERCLMVAEQQLFESARRRKVPTTTAPAEIPFDALMSATATLFIEACRSGVAEPKPKIDAPEEEA